jgi:hypothetical protein
MVGARFQSIFLKKCGWHAATVAQVENGLDRATVTTGAQEGAVGSFAQQQVEGADDDGFARAGFAGNDVAATLQLQCQIGNQRQISDAQRAQHSDAAFIINRGKVRSAISVDISWVIADIQFRIFTAHLLKRVVLALARRRGLR